MRAGEFIVFSWIEWVLVKIMTKNSKVVENKVEITNSKSALFSESHSLSIMPKGSLNRPMKIPKGAKYKADFSFATSIKKEALYTVIKPPVK